MRLNPTTGSNVSNNNPSLSHLLLERKEQKVTHARGLETQDEYHPGLSKDAGSALKGAPQSVNDHELPPIAQRNDPERSELAPMAVVRSAPPKTLQMELEEEQQQFPDIPIDYSMAERGLGLGHEFEKAQNDEKQFLDSIDHMADTQYILAHHLLP